jgi:hypothetical protein
MNSLDIYGRYTYWNDAPDDANAFGYVFNGVVEVAGAQVDITPPTTTATQSGQGGSPGWYIGPVTVTLSATDPDDASGTLIITYSLDGGPSATYNPGQPIVITTDGVHTLTYQSRDPAGNVEATQTQLIRVDQAPPVTTATATGQAGSSDWYNGPVTVTMAATQYSLDGGATWTAGTSVALTSGSVYTLSYRSIDVAGNVEATQSQTFDVVDRIPVTALMACSAPSSVYGQTVTINVQIVPPSGAGTPTGTVIFMDSSGNQVLGESKLAGSVATLSVSSLEVGTHAIRAIYLGDGQFDHLVTDSATQSVSPASTSMTFVVEAAASHRGFILHATVNPVSPAGGIPTGSVAFAVGGTCFRKVRVVNGQAELFVTNRNALGRSFNASYRCDARCYKPTVSKAVFASRRLARSVPSAPRVARAGPQTTRVIARHLSAKKSIGPPGDRLV